jgi:hypothetical protein
MGFKTNNEKALFNLLQTVSLIYFQVFVVMRNVLSKGMDNVI